MVIGFFQVIALKKGHIGYEILGENGKIFGSVNNIQIADEIKAAGFEVDRKAIKIIGGNPSNLGKFEADIKLFRDVDVKITFEVQEA